VIGVMVCLIVLLIKHVMKPVIQTKYVRVLAFGEHGVIFLHVDILHRLVKIAGKLQQNACENFIAGAMGKLAVILASVAELM
jgi:hypothetical protein